MWQRSRPQRVFLQVVSPRDEEGEVPRRYSGCARPGSVARRRALRLGPAPDGRPGLPPGWVTPPLILPLSSYFYPLC